MNRDLRALPKVELHVHLEGSMRATTVVEFAERYGVELPDGLRDGRYVFRDFRHFIDEWVAGLRCLRSPEDFRRIALEFCEDQADEGIRYQEVFFSLPDHAGKIRDWDETLEAVLDGFAEGARRFGVRTGLLVDVVRGIDMRLSRRAMKVAARHGDAGVLGLTLGGEEEFAPEPYAEIFADARAAGLRSVPHAGETRGPASIRGAVGALGADRIAHGIRALEDAALVDLLIHRGIALDVCPTSNLRTRSVPSLAEHPLPAMLEAGLTCTVGSDDPSMFGSRLTGEYEVCRSVFGFDDEAIAALALAGVGASFADEGTKQGLAAEIRAWISAPA